MNVHCILTKQQLEHVHTWPLEYNDRQLSIGLAFDQCMVNDEHSNLFSCKCEQFKWQAMGSAETIWTIVS